MSDNYLVVVQRVLPTNESAIVECRTLAANGDRRSHTPVENPLTGAKVHWGSILEPRKSYITKEKIQEQRLF